MSLTGGAYPVVQRGPSFEARFGWVASWPGEAVRISMPVSSPIVHFSMTLNGIYAPKLGKHAAAELSAGIGWESLRFYQGFTSCGAISCTDFVSSNHFMGHFGAGLRYYFHGHFFVRPEARPLPDQQQSGVQFSPGHTLWRISGILVHAGILKIGI